MHIVADTFRPRAKVRIHHEIAYDYDDKRGLWVTKPVDEDQVVDNIVTDAGLVRIHSYNYATSRGSLGTGFNYIGLSDNASAPASGDTTLTGELAVSGLARAQGTVTLPSLGGNQTTVYKLFTYLDVSAQGVQKSALFDASSVGVMAHEVQFAQRTLNTNDTLAVTYTITIA